MAVLMLCALCVPASAAMAPGVIVRVYDGETILYEKEDIWDIVFPEIKTKCESEWADKKSLECVIDLTRDCTIFSLAECNYLPMPLTINLHGNLLELGHGDYWEFDHDLTINGDGGRISTNHSGDEYNCSFWVDSGELTVSGVTVENMKTNMRYPVFATGDGCTKASFTDCKFTNCSSSKYGGAICMEQTGKLTLTRCTFKNCSAQYGGAVYLEDFISLSTVDALDADKCTFESCKATSCGGALYFYHNSIGDKQFFQMKNCTIHSCSADYGGAVYMDCNNSKLDLRFMPVRDLTRLEKDGLDYTKIDDRYYLEVNVIDSCSATYYGGAVYCNGEWDTVDGGEIFNCSAQYGGGIFFNSELQVLENAAIHKCRADESGGAYYTEYPSGDYPTRIIDCTFYDNTPADGNTASVLSEGNMTVVVGIACAVVFGLGGFILGTKKKKPALADGEE